MVPLEIRSLATTDDGGWDDAISRLGGATIFHSAAWLTVLERVGGARQIRLAFYDGSQLVGVLPLFQKSLGLFRVWASPFAIEETPHLGPLVTPRYLERCLLTLRTWM